MEFLFIFIILIKKCKKVVLFLDCHCSYYIWFFFCKYFDIGWFQAFHEASLTKGKPTALLAKTYKGKHFPNIEDAEEWHGKPLGDKAVAVISVCTHIIIKLTSLCFNVSCQYLTLLLV